MRLFTKTVFLFVILLNSVVGLAQDTVRILVQSKDNGLPVDLIYVNVYSANSNDRMGTTTTNEAGIETVFIDSFPVIIEAVGVGYEMERINLNTLPTKEVQVKVSKSFSPLNEVVVTGVANPIKPLDAFANYKVITSSQMQAQGAVNVQDALAYQLNAITSTDGVLGAQIRMQGMDGNKVKILMDGVPINGREGGNIDLSQFNVYNLERIEIIQGPMSVMYGTDALGGVINLISKNSKKEMGLNGEAYYESVGKYNFNLTATKSFDKHHFSLGGGRNYFDGEINRDYRSYVFKPKEQYLGNFNYNFRKSEKFNLRLASDFIKEKVTNKDTAQISSYQGFAFDELYNVTRSINRLTADGKLGKKGHYQFINGHSYYHRTKNRYRKDLVSLNEVLTPNEGDQDTSTFHEFSLRGMYENKVEKLFDYTIGYDVNLQKANSQKIPGGKTNINDYALFTTISQTFFQEKLKLQGGLRAAYNSVYKTPVIPSFSLLYKARTNVSLRASYSKGFRSPSLKELYLDFQDVNHKVFGNTQLKPEAADHFQASASWMVFEKKTNYAQVLITGYYNNVYNQISLAQRYPFSQNADSALIHDYTNINRMRNIIANVELEGQYSNFHYKLGYAYAYTFPQTGEYNGFETHQITTTLQYLWKWSKLNFSLFNSFSGAQPFVVSNIDGTSTYVGKRPAYNMMDISVSRKFWKQNIQITAGVKNVFDIVGFSSGAVVTSTHGNGSNVSFMPRSVFTSLRLNID